MGNPTDPERCRQAHINRSRGQTGQRKSEETKQKISKSMTGPNNPNFGRSLSPEVRQKLKAACGRFS